MQFVEDFVELEDSSLSYNIKSAVLESNPKSINTQRLNIFNHKEGLNAKRMRRPIQRKFDETLTKSTKYYYNKTTPQQTLIKKSEWSGDVLKETHSSALKRRRRFKDNCENSSIYSNSVNKPMLVIEKNSNHYYAPKTFDLPERLQFLNQGDCLNPNKINYKEEDNTYRPCISRISRDIVRSKQTLDKRKVYEEMIKNTSQELEDAIREIDNKDKGGLNYTQLCTLLSRIRRGPIEIEYIAKEIWDLVKPNKDYIKNESLYNLFMILIGTKGLNREVTYELLEEFVKEERINIEDIGNYIPTYREL